MSKTIRWAAVGLVAIAVLRSVSAVDRITLSVVGTNDLHGEVFPRNGHGGLALFAGYVNNLRAARASDGAVLLIDAGDTFLGTVESHLSEGALVVDAYNALGYTAAAIGNHEFDFGAVDPMPPQLSVDGDPRGALKALAARAAYPFLAANLLDESTRRPVQWPNVKPGMIVDAAGLKVGILGVMTIEALRTTLPANVHGLRVAPLTQAIADEASALRSRGADIVIVAAHAGGRCGRFDQPTDLSSCDPSAEIFDVARSLPHGLVNVIVAGHTHAGLAHMVEGVAIIEAFSRGVAFGRVDLVVDRQTKQITSHRIFAPRDFAAEARAGAPLQYEGQPVVSDDRIAEAMMPALTKVHRLQAIPLGAVLDTPIGRGGDLESPLGNLFADAMRASIPGADVGVNNNLRGGLRADLPAGPLTFGALYNAFPYDNRLVTLSVTGAQMQEIFADEMRQGRRGALGISGIRVRAACVAGELRVTLTRDSGELIDPADRLLVVTTDMLATGSVFGTARFVDTVAIPRSAPIARELVTEWVRRRGGHLRAEQFGDADRPRWQYSNASSSRCK